jgi:hypothetical protein
MYQKIKYHVIILQAGRDRWQTLLIEALEERRELLYFSEAELSIVKLTEHTDINQINGLKILVLLKAQNQELTLGQQSMLDLAIGSSHVILPVYDYAHNEGDAFNLQIPVAVSKYHAFGWRDDDSARELANILLESLGLSEKERRVFISYRRKDGTGYADQLYDMLHRCGFRAFKDDYTIRHGEVFQKALWEHMDEIGYLLLLETPELDHSYWVAQELNYAVKKHYGVAIVRFPRRGKKRNRAKSLTETTGAGLGQPIFEVASHEIIRRNDHNNERRKVLKISRVNELKQFIIDSHGERMVARKKYLFDSIIEKCEDVGKTFTVYSQWRIVVEGFLFSRPVMIGICARTPQPADLYQLEQDMLKAKKQWPDLHYAILAHDADNFEEIAKALNYWSLKGNLVDLMVLEQLLTQL